MDTSFIINELGEDRSRYFNAVAPPVMQTSNFAFNTVAEMSAAFENEHHANLYTRGVNPTAEILAKKLAALDGAEEAMVLNSGASAIFAAVMPHIRAGDHIVSVQYPYNWAQQLFNNILPRFGVSVTYVDGTLVQHFETAIRENTRLIYMETPNSWTFDMQDIRAVVSLAKQRGILTVCDNSYCTPLFQNPILLGVDLVLQSASKYIAGHSDVVAGVLSGSASLIRKTFYGEFMTAGLQISPWNAWLMLRGLRTLPLRLQKISETTKKVVAWLKKHPRIEKIYYPFDEDHPQYALARQQMSGACGLISVLLKATTYDEITSCCEKMKCFLLAVSWGGYESLVLPKCAAIGRANFDASISSHRMIRFYFGLEEPGYLIADLEQALAGE